MPLTIVNAQYILHVEMCEYSVRLFRYLKARDYNVDEAEKVLRGTVEWRRKHKPLSVDCRWCHERPGFHCVVRRTKGDAYYDHGDIKES